MLGPIAFAALMAASLGGDASFEQGVALYRGLEYEQAVFRFEEVALREGLPPEDKATALVWLGLAWAGTGDLDAARRFFGDALRTDPRVTLPDNVSPRIVALFNEVRAAAAPKATTPATTTTGTTAPATTTTTTTVGPDDEDGGVILPAVFTGVGVVSIAAGGVLAALAVGAWNEASDPDAFQDDAKRAADTMGNEIVGAMVLVPMGIVVAGVGGWMLADALE